jgi:hypothetical protein
LGPAAITGNLTITSQGHITQSGLIDVDGTSDFIIDTTLLRDILLDTFANDLTGAVSIGTQAGGTINDFRLRNVSPFATLPALGAVGNDITIIFDASGIAAGNNGSCGLLQGRRMEARSKVTIVDQGKSVQEDSDNRSRLVDSDSCFRDDQGAPETPEPCESVTRRPVLPDQALPTRADVLRALHSNTWLAAVDTRHSGGDVDRRS